MADPIPVNPYGARPVSHPRRTTRSTSHAKQEFSPLGLAAACLMAFYILRVFHGIALPDIPVSTAAVPEKPLKPDRVFTVQVGAFKTKSEAEKRKRIYIAKKIAAPEILKDGKWWVLLLGQYPNKAQALQQEEILKSKGVETWVRTRNARKKK